MESNIEKIVVDAFGSKKFEVLNRLIGGRSNYTYVVKVENAKYTVRIPGKNGNLFVNREYERKNLNAVNQLHINNETVYLDIKSGVKVSKFIEGNQMFGMEYEKYFDQICDVLKRVHSADLFVNDYSPMDRLAVYESFCNDLGYEQSEKYYMLKDSFCSYLDFLNDDKQVACHNDAQPSNFIVGEDGKVYLTDWEFAGNNYASYDIACFSDNDINNSFELLNFYLGREATKSEKKRVCLWRMFQTLQWCNVAMYKELIGLSQELLVDFKKVSNDYLTFAGNLLKLAESLDENR